MIEEKDTILYVLIVKEMVTQRIIIRARLMVPDMFSMRILYLWVLSRRKKVKKTLSYMG